MWWQNPPISGSGRRVLYILGGLWCGGTGVKAGLVIFGKRVACYDFSEACADGVQVEGQGSSISEGGRRVSFVKQ